jgi:2-polyprenyl-3-methyl-5-hydroxy-6-metoxy-1,4-benzoquinol methylase
MPRTVEWPVIRLEPCSEDSLSAPSRHRINPVLPLRHEVLMTATLPDAPPSAPRPGAREALASFLHRAAMDTRDDRVVAGIRDLVPQADSILDVGCSCGRLAVRIAAALGATDVRGADVQLQPDALIPVSVYDGSHLPFPDREFDLVTIIDVLHHADDPLAVVRESLRVLKPDGRIVVKDHLRLGTWSKWVLLAMDTASNFGVHVRTAGRYLSPAEWTNLVAGAGGHIETMVWPFQVHDLPWRLVARNEYHLLLRVRAA